jgi:hypothetical protein
VYSLVVAKLAESDKLPQRLIAAERYPTRASSAGKSCQWYKALVGSELAIG